MYRYLDAVLVRGTACPLSTAAEPWPDLSDHADAELTWKPWLRQVMQSPDFAAALDLASPSLTRRVRQICDEQPVPPAAARSAVLSVMRYVLRSSGRATPFGLFAGVAPGRIGDAQNSCRVGSEHRAVVRVDAGWLAAVVEDLEAEPTLWPRLNACANNLAFEQDGHLVLEHRPQRGDSTGPAHVHLRVTDPVQAAMALAAAPIRLADLVEKLAARFPEAGADVVHALLSGLVAQGFLVTSLRPAMTTTDPMGHVLGELRNAGAADLAETSATVRRLRTIDDEVRCHNRASTPTSSASARERRARLRTAMAAVRRTPEPALAVDLRLDWDVTVPTRVADEVARAAGLLLRLARRRVLHPGWAQWHGRFLERYGPRALVPVREAVDADIGLGYPAGYLGGPPLPDGDTLTDRDTLLLALAQKAAQGRQREVVLDEPTITELTADGFEPPPQPTTELTVRVHTSDERTLVQGHFTLAIIGVSRAAGTTTGRFLHLVDREPDDGKAGDVQWQRLSTLLAAPSTRTRGALTPQISAPPLHSATQNVAHAPRTLPHLLSIGEYRGNAPEELALDDLAVGADTRRIYLVSLSRRRPVEPTALNAVAPERYTHPLVRFLAEAPHALGVPCTTFDWGAAAQLPFLPALRYGRTILSPARWLLAATDTPDSTASAQEWDEAFQAWCERANLPRHCYLGEGDQRIGLDTAEPAHRVLLRTQLQRTGTMSLRALPEPAPITVRRPGSALGSGTGTAGWSGGYTHEIVVPLMTTDAPEPPPPWLAQEHRTTVRTHGHLPSNNGRFYIKLYGHPDRQTAILTRHLPLLLAELPPEARYWFLRYHDPDPHLRLRLLVDGDDFASSVDAIAAWSDRLRRQGLVARVQWDTDFPETARFGGSTAMEAAESYFVADSAAALAELTAGGCRGGADTRALAAASLLDLASAFLPDPSEAMHWLIQHTRPDTSAPPRWLYDQALALANPHDANELAARPRGRDVLAGWACRRTALAAYRGVLEATGAADVFVLLPELLHLHHVRIAGVDPKGERACLHLARAAALSWSTRPSPVPSRTH